MRPGKLFWKIFLGNVALLTVMLMTSLWVIGHEVNRVQDNELTAHLTAQAQALCEVVKDRFDIAHGPELDGLIKRIGKAQSDSFRVTLIMADGKVLADSEANPADMESLANRVEVAKALLAGSGQDTRLSHTVNRSLRYVAVAVGGNNPATHLPAGVVRVAMPLRSISEEEGSIRRLIWGAGLLILAAAMTLALGLARLWSRPIQLITQAARNISQGNLDTRIPSGGTDELSRLARSLNEMRVRITEHMHTIDLQKRTLESLLAQLHEGVVVSGPNGRIALMNPAAARMLDIRPAAAEPLSNLQGPSVETCIAQHELQQLLLPAITPITTADGNGIAEIVREVRLRSRETGSEVALLARASDITLPSLGSGQETADTGPATQPGRLLVLTDVTSVTRLLQMRADFSSNASHELRTPLSAIRAALETLMQINLAEEADSARQFLAVMDRHSRRLEMLVSDLLELSRLESPRAQFRANTVRVRELLAGIQDERADQLSAKQLHLVIDVHADVAQIETNEHLLRIVLDNLIDNAIKFTNPDGHIQVECREAPPSDGGVRQVAITVSDDGCGIPEGEQGRVFERFYQVERARSGGELRGTGLGLSIVRHAVAAMKGSIELRSEPGKGTRITMRIPRDAGTTAP